MAERKYIGPFRIDEVVNNQYKVIRLLGQGGHAFVYECYDELLDATVALKVIAPLGRGTELLKRAKAEAQVMFRLAHPNIVRVYSALVVDDLICIVMEKLEGVTLRMLLALLGRLTVTEALKIVRQVAVGVGEAHKLNVVHRDIKPDNVFILPPDNSVKVLDFGIAKFMGHGLQTTNKDRLHGTPIYMSPEHLRYGKVTAQSDIYQLGTVLFELIGGVNPCLLGNENYDAQQIGFVQISRVAPPLSTLVRGITPGLDWLVQCATAKDPSQRFATMADMIQAIDRALEERAATHPSESANIRYVNEALMVAAKELASNTHPDDLLARGRPGDEADRAKDPIELAQTEALPHPAAVPPAEVNVRPAEQPPEKPAYPAAARPKVAPTVEIKPRARPSVATEQPPISTPKEERVPTSPPRTGNVRPTPVAASGSGLVSPLDVRAATIARDPSIPVAPASPRQAPTQQRSRPSIDRDTSNTPLMSVSKPLPRPQGKGKRQLTAGLVLSPIVLGSIVGVGVSLQWYKYEDAARAASSAQAEAALASVVASPESPPILKSAAAAPSAAAPMLPSAVASTVPTNDRTVVSAATVSRAPEPDPADLPLFPLKPEAPTPAPAKTKRVGATKPDSNKATAEELARMRARVKEFDDDMALELKGKGTVKP
ncbi:MAG: protein kinase [Polyangiaceae bacterium]